MLLTLFEVDLKIKGLNELMLGIECKVKIERMILSRENERHFGFEKDVEF